MSLQIDSVNTSMIVCFILGALHALEPGHGKTALAAHILTEKSYAGAALAAFSTALAHSVSIFLVCVLVHSVRDWGITDGNEFVFERALNFTSGAVLILVAAWILVKSYRDSSDSHGPTCGCPHHAKSEGRSGRSLRTVLLGFAVGLMPCPTAIAALSQAITSRDWFSALVVIVTFALGIFIGLFVVCSLLGAQVGPRLQSSSVSRWPRVRVGTLQGLAIGLTGLWHLFF